MTRSEPEGSSVETPDASTAPGQHRVSTAGVAAAILILGGCLAALAWIGQGGYAVAATYGELGGGWAQLLVLLALGVGGVVGGGLVLIARLLHRHVHARWLVTAGVLLALVSLALSVATGLRTHTTASGLADDACDDPVGPALVSVAAGLEPGPVVRQNGSLTSGLDDGRCVVAVNVDPDTDIDVEIARVAAAAGWSRTQQAVWISPDDVVMTFDVTEEPETMVLVELHGHRATRRERPPP